MIHTDSVQLQIRVRGRRHRAVGCGGGTRGRLCSVGGEEWNWISICSHTHFNIVYSSIVDSELLDVLAVRRGHRSAHMPISSA